MSDDGNVPSYAEDLVAFLRACLAEVDAKRRIIDDYEAYEKSIQRAVRSPGGYQLGGRPLGRHDGLEFALRAIAQCYADRPGYRQEWRVGDPQ